MPCIVCVKNGEIPEEEKQAYVDRAIQKFGFEPDKIDITICGDEVELDYTLPKKPFHRLRRITGYLVGDLGRWNNAKLSEEKDRVTHI